MKISKILLTLSIGLVSIPTLAYESVSNYLEQDKHNIREQESIVRQQKQIVEQQEQLLRQQKIKLEELRKKLRSDEINMYQHNNHSRFNNEDIKDRNHNYFYHN